MIFEKINEYVSGGITYQRFNIIDDSGDIVFCGSVLADKTSEQILAEHEPASQQNTMIEEVTDFEKDILDKKRNIKNLVVLSIKTQTEPTIDSVVNDIPFEPNLVTGIIIAYQNISFEKGYISENSWEAFVADIKASTVEELLGRK